MIDLIPHKNITDLEANATACAKQQHEPERDNAAVITILYILNLLRPIIRTYFRLSIKKYDMYMNGYNKN